MSSSLFNFLPSTCVSPHRLANLPLSFQDLFWTKVLFLTPMFDCSQELYFIQVTVLFPKRKSAYFEACSSKHFAWYTRSRSTIPILLQEGFSGFCGQLEHELTCPPDFSVFPLVFSSVLMPSVGLMHSHGIPIVAQLALVHSYGITYCGKLWWKQSAQAFLDKPVSDLLQISTIWSNLESSEIGAWILSSPVHSFDRIVSSVRALCPCPLVQELPVSQLLRENCGSVGNPLQVNIKSSFSPQTVSTLHFAFVNQVDCVSEQIKLPALWTRQFLIRWNSLPTPETVMSSLSTLQKIL